MKICMIGMGSIGKRHLYNIVKILNERKILFTIDALRSNNQKLEQSISDLLSREYYSVEDLPNDYDVIFITNPTSFHYITIEKMVLKTKNMFIEKPLFDHIGYDIDHLGLKSGGIYYVACPLRYKSVLKNAKQIIKKEKVYSARIICSSYLPEWRPNVDYRFVYSAQKSLGGGAVGDLIHEWDYIIDLFGVPEKVEGMAGHYSDLEINTEDLVVYIIQYKDKLLELHLDYFGRENKRQMELYCESGNIVVDLVRDKIVYKNDSTKDISFQDDDFYKKEIGYFFDMLLKGTLNINSIEQAYQTLRIANQNIRQRGD